MQIKVLIFYLLVFVAIFPPYSWAENQAITDETPNVDIMSAAPTEINAETMNFDIENRKAIFSGNVKVVDEKLNLQSDEMKIEFDVDNNLEKIEATGNVVINSEGNSATGGMAVYNFKDGVIILSLNPILMQGLNRVIGADRIIYRRKEKKFETEGGSPQIIIFEGNNSSSFLDILKGEDKKEE